MPFQEALAMHSPIPEVFASEQMGQEFSVYGAFMDTLEQLVRDDAPLPTGSEGEQQPQTPQDTGISTSAAQSPADSQASTGVANTPTSSLPPSVLTSERFLLAAADPSAPTPEQRLAEIINAKYEAGLLKPYNYSSGYARFHKYMDTHMTSANRQRILTVLETFRPAFRRVAQSLTDLDLIVVEESFERLLLEYDRVFSSVGIPACVWRRTGEIVKANKEFAALVDVPYEQLRSPSREAPVGIYEVMTEESAVNYWEKYANVAFDSTQKAVLTSCVLKSSRGTLRPCCFSFTIRRDRYNLPFCLVGNFLPLP